jgi:hypothetical protein
MEYCFRSLDPRDLTGKDINFYLTGRAVKNDLDRNAKYSTSESILFNGVRQGVLFRQLLMRKPPNNGVGYIIDLAEITIPGGVIRVDRSRLAFEHELTLGHYGLPHLAGKKALIQKSEDSRKKTITAAISGRRLAQIAYRGWDRLDSQVHQGNNAEAEESSVIYAYRKRTAKNPAIELMITVMLHKMDDGEWTGAELDPIENIRVFDIMPSGSVAGAELTLANGQKYIVDFNEIDGFKSC